MSPRAKRQKIHPDRDMTAAFAASQPLFSALRSAITSLDSTKARLTVARDIVQSLHVKIANDDQYNDPSRHNAYMAAITTAWISSTDAFCNVFEELVSVSAADPSEGRDAGPRHDQFVGLLQSARSTNELAKRLTPESKETTSHSGAPAEDHDEGEDMVETTSADFEEAESETTPLVNEGTKPHSAKLKHEEYTASPEGQAAGHDNGEQRGSLREQTSKHIGRKLGNTRHSKNGDKILWKDGALKVPYKTLAPDEKRAWGILASRQKHADRTKKQRQAKTSSQKISGNPPKSAESSVKPEQQTAEPVIEFEDVSAEVEARLKAKAEKRAAEKSRKSEKKRKRESGASVALHAQDGSPGPSDMAEAHFAAGPARKKTKQAVEAGAPNGVPSSRLSAASEKRKDAEQEPAVMAEQANMSRKRRKRAKN